MSIEIKILIFIIFLLAIGAIFLFYLLVREVKRINELEAQKHHLEMDREHWKKSFDEVNQAYEDLKRDRKNGSK